MLHDLARGAVAGALGTVVLNVTTYLDLAVRGRPASTMPSRAAGMLADRMGVSLSREGPDSDAAANRREGIGALLGYVTGIGVGAVWGAVAPRTRPLPLPAAAAVVGAGAMAGSDIPATASGLTDPRTWGASGWASDIVPHLLYGLTTAAAVERLWRR